MTLCVDMSILKDLSLGGLDGGQIAELVDQHCSILKYATRCEWATPANIPVDDRSIERTHLLVKF